MDDLAFDPAPFLTVSLVALCAALWWSKRAHMKALWRQRREPLAWALAVGVALCAWLPWWTRWPSLVLHGALLPGDAPSHARVALEIAREGLPHGWIEAYSGGFPFGPHYQSLALLISAALAWLGMGAREATWLVGLLPLLATAPLFVLAARAAGASPGAACLGALLLSWISPFDPFVGGPGVMVSQGLVSQALAMPLLVVLAACVLRRRAYGSAISGALLMAAHAQLAACTFAAALPAIVMVGTRDVRRRFLLASAGAAIAALALYLPGALTLAVPFGWPPVPAFRVVGWGPERLGAWLVGGTLLDAGRAPALSAVLWLALAALLMTWKSRASRGVLVMFATATLLAVSGPALERVGAAALLQVVSPVRMLALLPFAAACVVAVAATELSQRWRHALPAALALALWIGPPGHDAATASERRISMEEDRAGDPCGRDGWSGFDDPSVVQALASLRNGRFVVDKERSATPCPVRAGIELATAAPHGSGTGGPGSQVGVMLYAFDRHASRRAEALGVRYLLHRRAVRLDATWETIAEGDQAVLSRRRGGTDWIGVGCIVEAWSGSESALRAALIADLERDAPRSLRPHELVKLERRDGPFEMHPLARDDCDPRAAIAELESSPGERRAWVESRRPVDVVLRSTAFVGWRVEIDGALASWVRVAPGFVAVRVPAGRHQLVAQGSPPPGYLVGVVAGIVAVLLLAALEMRRDKAR